MTDQPTSSRSVVKMFTKARNFPQLIGKAPDGKKIPGGPYTLTQFVGAGVVGGLLWLTSSIWAHGGTITNVAIFVGLTGGTLWALGRLPQGARSPVSVIRGVARAVTGAMAPARINGAPVRSKRPHAVRGTVIIVDPPVTPNRADAVAAERTLPDRVDTSPVRAGTARTAPTRQQPDLRSVASQTLPRTAHSRPSVPRPAPLHAPHDARRAPAATGVQQLLALAVAAPAPTREKA
ncbi:hypothetical protein [Rhodococcoides fascians]|uniref:hypothetical protein n=1 Tax=Rhodococcoides fascians TaxID=1828 RepID=UPI00366FF905